jgi:beta-lactamase class A
MVIYPCIFFIRVLYNASYLSREMSEKALDYLLASDYKDGLVAGLPPGTQVAHKFGEYEREDMNQLHDCGIVYYPRHPYILSVMTRGSDKQMMADTIAEISRLIYEEVDGKFGPGKRR